MPLAQEICLWLRKAPALQAGCDFFIVVDLVHALFGRLAQLLCTNLVLGLSVLWINSILSVALAVQAPITFASMFVLVFRDPHIPDTVTHGRDTETNTFTSASMCGLLNMRVLLSSVVELCRRAVAAGIVNQRPFMHNI